MPPVRSENVIAIFLADIHLTIKPPVWRSVEPDWLEAQCRPLEEVESLQDKYECPILCAGDIFDRWNCSPELINWAIQHLPKMYAIPGQHDLPNHQYEDIHRSAYWTLVEADKILNMAPTSVRTIHHYNMVVYAFPHLYPIEPCPDEKKFFRIVIIHDYVWSGKHRYPNAPEEKRVETRSEKITNGKLYGYDVIVYGDNHKGFITKVGGTTVFNCGTLMRRKSDEIDYKPQVGLLLDTGEVIPHYLDTSRDKYLDTIEGKIDPELDMTSFIEELEKLGETALDFKDAMKRFFRKGKVISEVKQVIIDAMEKG